MLIHVFVYMYTYMWIHFQAAEFWESEPVPRQLNVQLHDHHLHSVSPEILQKLENYTWLTLDSTVRKRRFWHWTPWSFRFVIQKFQVIPLFSHQKMQPLLVSHSKNPLPPPSWHSPHSPHLWPNSMVARLAVPWSEMLLRPKSFWTSWFLGSLSKTSLAGWSHRWKKGDKVLFIPNECP